jgi:hypothetical protein
MDTHLIGIDLAKLLQKQGARKQEPQPVKAAQATAESVVKTETRAEFR